MTSVARRRAYAAALRQIEHERANPERGLDRCPCCGAWRYLGQCWTPLPVCLGESAAYAPGQRNGPADLAERRPDPDHHHSRAEEVASCHTV